jgi:hypothetical protein
MTTAKPTMAEKPKAGRRYHLAVALGLSTGAYAALLAGVTRLQAESEGQLVDQRRPSAAALDALGSAHDALESDLRSASDLYNRYAATYRTTAATLAQIEKSLGTLNTTVRRVEGGSQTLPDRVALPTVSSTVVTVIRPTAHATTGGSGH